MRGRKREKNWIKTGERKTEREGRQNEESNTARRKKVKTKNKYEKKDFKT